MPKTKTLIVIVRKKQDSQKRAKVKWMKCGDNQGDFGGKGEQWCGTLSLITSPFPLFFYPHGLWWSSKNKKIKKKLN